MNQYGWENVKMMYLKFIIKSNKIYVNTKYLLYKHTNWGMHILMGYLLVQLETLMNEA
jgi:hypothetical protein